MASKKQIAKRPLSAGPAQSSDKKTIIYENAGQQQPKDSILVREAKRQCITGDAKVLNEKKRPSDSIWHPDLIKKVAHKQETPPDSDGPCIPKKMPAKLVPTPPKMPPPPHLKQQDKVQSDKMRSSASSAVPGLSREDGTQPEKKLSSSSSALPAPLAPGLFIRKDNIKSDKMQSSSSSAVRVSSGRSAFHIVFLIDTSKSMASHDVVQKTGAPISRLAAVWNAVEGFSKLLMNYPDILTSLVLFNDEATVKFQGVRFRGPKGLLSHLPALQTIQPRFGGKYIPALEKLCSLRSSFPDAITIGVMLSDGRPGDSPNNVVAFTESLSKRFGCKCIVHTVMFGPDARDHSCCLERVAKAAGGDFHANAQLDATALQRTFIRMSASISTMRSSVLAFGEQALKRIPEKKLEPEAAWTQCPEKDLFHPSISSKVKSYIMLPSKGGSELDLQRTGSERIAYLHKKPFAEGAQRYASHLWWIALDGKSWHLVVKESKFEGAHETPQKVHGFFLKNHRRAQDLAVDFNAALSSSMPTGTDKSENVKVRFTPAYVVELADEVHSGFRYLTAEKFIEGQYVKFNANDGWVNCATADSREGEIAAAFSHFSYEQSKGESICVDIQGVGFKWTDPQINSKVQEYGAGDLGPEGIKLFFHSHVCNRFCKLLGLKVVNAKDVNAQVASAASEDPSRDTSCLLCLDKERTVVNQPCGHLCLCLSCLTSQPKVASTCVVCRKAVKSVLKLSVSDAIHHPTFRR